MEQYIVFHKDEMSKRLLGDKKEIVINVLGDDLNNDGMISVSPSDYRFIKFDINNNSHEAYKTLSSNDLKDIKDKIQGGKTFYYKNLPILEISALKAADGFHFRAKGLLIEHINANNNPNIYESFVFDIPMTASRYIDGAEFGTIDSEWDDKISFDIVHPISGNVLEPYVDNWGVGLGKSTLRAYKGLLFAGLILRITYFKKGVHTPKLIVNGFMHEKI